MHPAAAAAGKRERVARFCHRAGMLGLLRGARDFGRRDVRILAYHRVLDVDEERFDFDLALVSAGVEQFREQMLHVRRHYHPIRMEEWLDAAAHGRRLPPRCVVVTFDDGYDDNRVNAMPVLRDLGMSACFFVSTGHIDDGSPFAYDWLVHMILVTPARHMSAPEIGIEQALPAARGDRRALATVALGRMKWLSARDQSALIERLEREWQLPRGRGHPDCRPMTWQQLREMRDSGMEIGSHGVSHRMLGRLDTAGIHDEIVGSKRRLEEELGSPPILLSYPVGNLDAWNQEVIDQARTSGFRAGCSYVAGANRWQPDSWWTLRRLPVEREMDGAWFAAMLAMPEAFGYPSRLRNG